MATFTYISRHAFKRIGQRMKIGWEDVANILDRGLFVDTGHKPGFMGHHLLFYSSVDQTCFVAIQDIHSGTVVTILPLDYHKNLAWEISDDLCERARDLYESSAASQTHIQNKPMPSNFFVSGHYIDVAGRQKTKLMMKTQSAPYEDDIGKFLKDVTLPKYLEKIADEIGLTSISMFAISFRHGKNGIPVVIELR